MIRATHLRDYVIRPVLTSLVELKADQSDMSDGPATDLLLGTAMQESKLGEYLHQLMGPALGVWQMEPKTHDDIWTNYLAFRGPLRAAVTKTMVSGMERTEQLVGNLYYSCAMARVLYMRAGPIPKAVDFPRAADYASAQAAFYIKHYNAGGKATVAEYLDNWHAVQALLAGGQ